MCVCAILLANSRWKSGFREKYKKMVKWSCFLHKWANFDRKIVLSRNKAKHCNKVQCFPGVFLLQKKPRVGAIFQGRSDYSNHTLLFRPNLIFRNKQTHKSYWDWFSVTVWTSPVPLWLWNCFLPQLRVTFYGFCYINAIYLLQTSGVQNNKQ